jgi:hypothetical protein
MASKKQKKKKKAAKAKAPTRKNTSRRKRPTRGGGGSPGAKARIHQGVALEKAGQSGDVEGLSNAEEADSESVSELAEEGQAFEASVVDGVENAPDADQGEVTTEEVPEDDIPAEYRNRREQED